MNLKKAIELLRDMKLVMRSLFPPDEQAALSLGIEALKRILKERDIENDPGWGHLPSETID